MARKPAIRLAVRITANFERNLADIERFLTEAEMPRAYHTLLDELLDTVIANLERFPGIGRPFLAHPARSIRSEIFRSVQVAASDIAERALGWNRTGTWRQP